MAIHIFSFACFLVAIISNYILINKNYRSERQSHIYYWQYFDHMLKQAHDENNNIICLGDMNKNFLVFFIITLMTFLSSTD